MPPAPVPPEPEPVQVPQQNLWQQQQQQQQQQQEQEQEQRWLEMQWQQEVNAFDPPGQGRGRELGGGHEIGQPQVHLHPQLLERPHFQFEREDGGNLVVFLPAAGLVNGRARLEGSRRRSRRRR